MLTKRYRGRPVLALPAVRQRANVMAFSPTDTMPLARWAKVLLTLQDMVAVSTLAMVAARAVNVLG